MWKTQNVYFDPPQFLRLASLADTPPHHINLHLFLFLDNPKGRSVAKFYDLIEQSIGIHTSINFIVQTICKVN